MLGDGEWMEDMEVACCAVTSDTHSCSMVGGVSKTAHNNTSKEGSRTPSKNFVRNTSAHHFVQIPSYKSFHWLLIVTSDAGNLCLTVDIDLLSPPVRCPPAAARPQPATTYHYPLRYHYRYYQYYR